jgi:hypothetical protein
MQYKYDSPLSSSPTKSRTLICRRSDSVPYARSSRPELPYIKTPELSPHKSAYSPVLRERLDDIFQMCEETKNSLKTVRSSSNSHIKQVQTRFRKYSDRIDGFFHLEKIEGMPSLMDRLVENNFHILADMRNKIRLSMNRNNTIRGLRKELTYKKANLFKLRPVE